MTLLMLLVSCAQPVHLQYDYGRALLTAQKVQADLTRPSVKDFQPVLSGPEAEALRLNAAEKLKEVKSGEQEMINE
ncbi:MAG: hypothetical protein ACOZNI_37130 [Myxococcota bacterium]